MCTSTILPNPYKFESSMTIFSHATCHAISVDTSYVCKASNVFYVLCSLKICNSFANKICKDLLKSQDVSKNR